MLTLLLLIFSCILGIISFSLGLFAFLHYKKVFVSLPKTEETYKKLLFIEDLFGLLLFFVSSFGQIAMVFTYILLTKNWGSTQFHLYLVPLVVSFTIGMLYLSFYYQKKRAKFVLTLTDNPHQYSNANLGILCYFKGMSTSLGNSVGLLLIFIFWALL